MKPLSLFLIILIQAVAFAANQELSDEQIRTKIVGTWLPDEELARTLTGEVTYKKDFTFAGLILMKLPDRTVPWEFAGKWKVESGKLTYEYTKSSIPDLLPVGRVSTDRIISISDKEFVSITEKGKRQVRIRKEK